ncbi:hypothetical protein [Ruegeria arenilitoris]|uniref:hypothetical protein n=1 Tax=Ruegeria arenilitoris TaxID=1173585 RepID=UPI001480DB58|nr:hypothetical protein [Ruegeria arenilitoris]
MSAEDTEQDTATRPAGELIRPATVDDLPRIVENGAKFHAKSKQPFPYDPIAAGKFARIMIGNDDSQIFISDTGMIGGVLTPSFYAPQWVMAVELFWWAERDGLKLLKKFEEWAEESNATEVRMTSLGALPRADRLLREDSYEVAEISYRKVL